MKSNRLYRVTYLRNGVDKHTVIIPSTSFGDKPLDRSKANMRHYIGMQIHRSLCNALGGKIEIIKYERVHYES